MQWRSWQWRGFALWVMQLGMFLVVFTGCGHFPAPTTLLSPSSPSSASLFLNNPTVIDSRDLSLLLAFIQLGSTATPTQVTQRATQIGGQSISPNDITIPLTLANLDYAQPLDLIDEADLALFLARLQLGAEASQASLANQMNLLTGSTAFTEADVLRIPGALPSPSPSPPSGSTISLFAGPFPTPLPISYTDTQGRLQTLNGFPGQVMILSDPDVNSSVETVQHITASGGSVLYEIPELGVYLAGVTPGSEAGLITDLQNSTTGLQAFPHFAVAFQPAADIPPASVTARASRTVTINGSALVGARTRLYIVDYFKNSGCDAHGDWVQSISKGDVLSSTYFPPLPAPGATIELSGVLTTTQTAAIDLPPVLKLIATDAGNDRAIINLSAGVNDASADITLNAETVLMSVLAASLKPYPGLVLVKASGDGVSPQNTQGVDLKESLIALHQSGNLSGVFGAGPRLFIVGGTGSWDATLKQTQCGIDRRNNYSSDINVDPVGDPDFFTPYMVYFPNDQMPACDGQSNKSGSSFAAPLFTNLVVNTFLAYPQENVATITQSIARANVVPCWEGTYTNPNSSGGGSMKLRFKTMSTNPQQLTPGGVFMAGEASWDPPLPFSNNPNNPPLSREQAEVDVYLTVANDGSSPFRFGGGIGVVPIAGYTQILGDAVFQDILTRLDLSLQIVNSGGTLGGTVGYRTFRLPYFPANWVYGSTGGVCGASYCAVEVQLQHPRIPS